MRPGEAEKLTKAVAAETIHQIDSIGELVKSGGAMVAVDMTLCVLEKTLKAIEKKARLTGHEDLAENIRQTLEAMQPGSKAIIEALDKLAAKLMKEPAQQQ